MSRVAKAAREYARSCFEGTRWDGNPVLITVDTALTSTGLKYFTVIVPRVIRFREQFPGLTFADAAKMRPDNKRLLRIFNNKRAWSVLINVSKVFSGGDELSKLRAWAQLTDPHMMHKDPIGQIKGVGINTFQYLRMQAGVDTIMPDRIIRDYIERETNKKVNNLLELISIAREYALSRGMSQVELCWRIWLEESDHEF